MQEFDEAKKNFLDAKEQHDALLKGLDKLLAGQPLAEAWIHPNFKHRMSVRNMHAEIEAQPQLAAAHEALVQIFWAWVLAGIQIEWRGLLNEYFEKPSDEKLRQAKSKFLADYDLN